jgi:phosphoglycolate phosphatase
MAVDCNINKSVRAVLFDLDGTLLDTAPDLADALNYVLQQEQRQPLSFEIIRPAVSNGAEGLMRLGFGDSLDKEKSEQLRKELIAYYQENLCKKTTLFDGMSELLTAFKWRKISWGIVTNKPAYLTGPLTEKLGLNRQTDCIISGDTTAHSKPHPEPILHACKQLNRTPNECIYIGDAQRDIEAGNRAGMRTVIAKYGYIANFDALNSWDADGIIDHPESLLSWLDENS